MIDPPSSAGLLSKDDKDLADAFGSIAEESVGSKFEQEFIDTEEDDNKPLVQAPSNLAQMSAAEKSISLIEVNLKGANLALQKTETSIKELEPLEAAAKGAGKKEMQKVIKRKQERVIELQKHIKEGTELLEKKKSANQKPVSLATTTSTASLEAAEKVWEEKYKQS